MLCYSCPVQKMLTHRGRVRHICDSKLTIIGSDNGLSPGRHQAIIWTNAGILLIGPPETNFNEILIEIHTFSFKKIYLKMSFGKWRAILSRPQCVNLDHVVRKLDHTPCKFAGNILIGKLASGASSQTCHIEMTHVLGGKIWHPVREKSDISRQNMCIFFLT